MSDLRAIAEAIKAARDQRAALAQRRMKDVADARAATQKALERFAEERARKAKQDAQRRAAELNAIRSRANALRSEAKGMLKTYERERNAIAQALRQEANALRQKLSADNQTRLNAHKTLMNRVNQERQATRERVRSIALDVERQLKTHEQTRRDGRDAWNRILGSAQAKATIPKPETPFAINIPFAPPKSRK
ncbi:MAG: hypothetical protein NZM06_11185 [Chloroherpetonaceae bacterium]|nr:hypothetical protein [Chloroherpetonaceae bacterium]MDW8438176.1 hypothetical protein [Chloroherpetonaceae bacterium]